MKSILIVWVLTLSTTLCLAEKGFEKAMESGLEQLQQKTHLDELERLSVYFATLAEEHSDEWLPLYYSAMCKLILSFQQPDSALKMNLINQAQEQIIAAMEVQSRESELLTLQGFLYQAMIMVDPVNNGAAYAHRAKEEFDKAAELDASNPRPYYLQALSIMHTPNTYGGGLVAACPLMQQANAMFASFKPASNLHPRWGAEDCSYYLKNCTDN